MKHFRSIIVTLVIFTLMISCKKEGPEGPQGPAGPTGISTAPDPALYNKWEVIYGLPSTRYVIFKNDNYVCVLDSTQYGFRSLSKALAFITSVQIKVYTTTYNYSIHGDTLRMTNNSDSIVLLKNADTPDETTWVTFVTVSDIINSPLPGGDGRQDIGFDGTNILWACDWNYDKLYKINPLTSTNTILSLAGGYYAPSVNYASAAIWIVNSTTIDKLDPSTGNVLSASPVLCTGMIRSLALIGQKMYFSSDGYIYTWDISTNEILQHFPFNASGMEYNNGYLYLLDEHHLHKCQLNPFHCVLTYYIDSPLAGSNMGGLTFDGSNFWVVCEDSDIYEFVLAKLAL
jgi:hypothetical protein